LRILRYVIPKSLTQNSLKFTTKTGEPREIKVTFWNETAFWGHLRLRGKWLLCFSIMNNNKVSILPNDVLLGRGPLRYRHPGNVVFRDLVRSLAIHYNIEAPSAKKVMIVRHIFEIILNTGGRFLHQDPPKSGKWNEAPPTIAILKIKHALRDARLLITKRQRKELQKMLLEMPSYKQESEGFHLIPEWFREPIVTQNPEWRTVIDNLPIQHVELSHTETDGLEMLVKEEDIQTSDIIDWDSAIEPFPFMDSPACGADTESTTLNDDCSLVNIIDSDDFFASCIKWLAHAN
jgi:hypothetical protein